MFQRLLVANRGEVAVRVARAARELGISSVGVASEVDLEASWTRAFDEVVCIGPAPPSESYLRMERIVQAALQTHASAIHPGWGFLAENARFARLVRQHGIAFVGPSARAIELMGTKSPAKRAMKAAGLPAIPGSDGPLASAEEAAACAQDIGYPVLLKADAGGGGRGMRRCQHEAELREAFSAASAEAEKAFGDGALYLERYLSGGRHIEVQVLCDGYGHGVHLFERECSVQRKHQKLLEESPSPALADERRPSGQHALAESERSALGLRAIRAALAVGYENAGTIEFLRAEGGALYFMEMNTRLQVEHPVTEATTGIDIVKEQLAIAAGRPLALSQERIVQRGHALECRINAEDPSQGFRPTPGLVRVFAIPTDRGPGSIRIDTHLSTGDRVPPHYDSLLAKVIAHAPTRELAIETMLRALSSAKIEGVATTIPLHLSVLADEAFRRGEYDTSSIPGFAVPAGA